MVRIPPQSSPGQKLTCGMNVLHAAAGEVATKAGLDCGGEVVTANTRTYVPEKKAETTVTNFLKKYIPESCDEVDFTKTCLYCLTPDRHFIIDKVPLRRVQS